MSSSTASFERICELAKGGMGSVELVIRREGTFERWYARKRLHEHLRQDAAFRAMFLDEARLAGAVRHPNVVSVLDVGEDQDGPFLMMDFVQGVAAAELIAHATAAGRGLPLQVALRVAMEAARGLHAAHEARGSDGKPLGLVHRDVSPQNILVGYDGSVRVTDFGIAKAFGNVSRTNTGVLKGNIGYLSPEQLRFEEASRQSDLFSLGVTLYELLSGERLYASADGLESARRILNEPMPDIGLVREDVPVTLVELTFELLAKDPQHRPATAGVVATRLEEILAPLIEGEGGVEVAAYMQRHFAERRANDEARLAQAVAAANEARRRATSRRSRRQLTAVALVALLLGAGAVVLRKPAARVPRPGSERTLWAGGWHTCARVGSDLFCWGKNDEGQLGLSHTLDQAVPSKVNGLSDPGTVAMGLFHTCACTKGGQAYCWGRNGEGQLGDGSTRSSTVPVRVPGLSDCLQVAAGSMHSCALRKDRTVSCWGRYRDAVDNLETTRAPWDAVLRPQPVPGLTDVLEVAANGGFSCARVRSGAVLCWGLDHRGQLGDGLTVNRREPASVVGLTDAGAVALGRRFACAARRNGEIACWGENSIRYDGTTVDRLVPTRAPGVTDAVELAAGLRHLCTVRRTGDLLCLGVNDAGQLGDGTQTQSLGFVRVADIERAYSLAAGSIHTCVRHARGISCWGQGQTGAVGDGTMQIRSRPVSLTGGINQPP